MRFNFKKIILVALLVFCTATGWMFAAEIHKAAKQGKLDEIKQLIKKDPKLVNSVNRLGQTPLLIAAYSGHKDIAEFLIKKGADLNLADQFGASPIHMSVLGSKIEITKLLVSKGADINKRTKIGKVPIQLAFEIGNAAVVDLFISRGVDINAPVNAIGRTLLHKAAALGKSNVVELLLSKGANINVKDKYDNTPYSLAVACGYKAVSDLLLSKGAAVDDKPQLEIYFIANEGFLIKSPIQSILIDGLSRNGYGQYSVTPLSVIKQMDSKSAPFENVKFLVFTHNHSDHFDLEYTEQFMTKNTGTILIAPKEILLELAVGSDKYNSIKHRSVAVTPPANSYTDVSVKGMHMKVVRMQHGPMEHVGYLVNLEGMTFFHMADVNLPFEKDFLKKLNLKNENIDVLFIPFWNFREKAGRDIIKESIAPKHIILMHIPTHEVENVTKDIEKYKNDFPNVMFFKEPLEKKVFSIK
jgi:ankyrin repeat protein